MGRLCSTKVFIDASVNTQTIGTILTRGTEIGFQYHDEEKSSLTCERFWSTDEVRILIPNILDQIAKGQGSFLTFNFDNSSCIMSFYPQSLGLCISISPAGDYWHKGDPSRIAIDFGRYLELLLRVCQDFAILKIYTYDEYFLYI